MILLITVLTMMALAFAALATRDSGFVRLQEEQAIAEETARSGIEFYLAYGLPHAPVALDPEHPERICRLEIKGSFLYSHGEINKGKRVTRTLCAPLWDLARVRSAPGKERKTQ